MSNIKKVVIAAPYTRLVRIHDTPNYVLFIAVKVPAGSDIVWPENVEQFNGTTSLTLSLTVSTDENANTERTLHKKYMLSSKSSDPNAEVLVEVVPPGMKSFMSYAGADTYNSLPVTETDSNAPYLYLHNTAEDAASADEVYALRCLIFLQGQLTGQSFTYDSSGQLAYNILIEENASSKVSELPAELLQLNTREFPNLAPVIKEFSVTVDLADGKSKSDGGDEKKKGSRRNKGSET